MGLVLVSLKPVQPKWPTALGFKLLAVLGFPVHSPVAGPGEKRHNGMWADIQPRSPALRSAAAALQLSTPVQTRPLTFSAPT